MNSSPACSPKQNKKRKHDSESHCHGKRKKHGIKTEDSYCWICHEPINDVSCIDCPRGYHTACLRTVSAVFSDDNLCPECQDKEFERETKSSFLTNQRLSEMLKSAASEFRKNFSSPNKNLFFCWTRTDDSRLVHTIDFNFIEGNINNKNCYYQSLTEVLSEVKWIHHNFCIMEGVNSSLAKEAEHFVKSFQKEVSDIEDCSMCYHRMRVGNRAEDFFAQICDPPHDIVWAQLKGSAPWPAKCLRVEAGKARVRFFGTHDKSDIAIGNGKVLHISLHHPTYKNSRITDENLFPKKKEYKNAVLELLEYVKNFETKFATPFKYYKEGTPYKSGFTTVKPRRKRKSRDQSLAVNTRENSPSLQKEVITSEEIDNEDPEMVLQNTDSEIEFIQEVKINSDSQQIKEETNYYGRETIPSSCASVMSTMTNCASLTDIATLPSCSTLPSPITRNIPSTSFSIDLKEFQRFLEPTAEDSDEEIEFLGSHIHSQSVSRLSLTRRFLRKLEMLRNTLRYNQSFNNFQHEAFKFVSEFPSQEVIFQLTNDLKESLINCKILMDKVRNWEGENTILKKKYTRLNKKYEKDLKHAKEELKHAENRILQLEEQNRILLKKNEMKKRKIENYRLAFKRQKLKYRVTKKLLEEENDLRMQELQNAQAVLKRQCQKYQQIEDKINKTIKMAKHFGVTHIAECFIGKQLMEYKKIVSTGHILNEEFSEYEQYTKNLKIARQKQRDQSTDTNGLFAEMPVVSQDQGNQELKAIAKVAPVLKAATQKAATEGKFTDISSLLEELLNQVARFDKKTLSVQQVGNVEDLTTNIPPFLKNSPLPQAVRMSPHPQVFSHTLNQQSVRCIPVLLPAHIQKLLNAKKIPQEVIRLPIRKETCPCSKPVKQADQTTSKGTFPLTPQPTVAEEVSEKNNIDVSCVEEMAAEISSLLEDLLNQTTKSAEKYFPAQQAQLANIEDMAISISSFLEPQNNQDACESTHSSRIQAPAHYKVIDKITFENLPQEEIIEKVLTESESKDAFISQSHIEREDVDMTNDAPTILLKAKYFNPNLNYYKKKIHYLKKKVWTTTKVSAIVSSIPLHARRRGRKGTRNSSKRKVEPVCITLSSDDEEPVIYEQMKSTAMQNYPIYPIESESSKSYHSSVSETMPDKPNMRDAKAKMSGSPSLQISAKQPSAKEITMIMPPLIKGKLYYDAEAMAQILSIFRPQSQIKQATSVQSSNKDHESQTNKSQAKSKQSGRSTSVNCQHYSQYKPMSQAKKKTNSSGYKCSECRPPEIFNREPSYHDYTLSNHQVDCHIPASTYHLTGGSVKIANLNRLAESSKSESHSRTSFPTQILSGARHQETSFNGVKLLESSKHFGPRGLANSFLNLTQVPTYLPTHPELPLPQIPPENHYYHNYNPQYVQTSPFVSNSYMAETTFLQHLQWRRYCTQMQDFRSNELKDPMKKKNSMTGNYFC